MEESKDPVRVVITGGGYGANTLVMGVVHDALCSAGFRQVMPHGPRGFAESHDKKRVASLLDICRCIHPDLFNTPVEVVQDLTEVRFTDDNIYPTTAALEEVIHKTVRNDYVDYYSEVTARPEADGRNIDEGIDVGTF